MHNHSQILELTLDNFEQIYEARLKDLRYTTEIEQKLDEIEQRVFGA